MRKRKFETVLFLLIIFVIGVFAVQTLKAEENALIWEEEDFTFSDSTITGFSDSGYEKAKLMTESSTLTFPAKATAIGANAFYIAETKAKIPGGIQGSVEFHQGITQVGNHAFQGNNRITGVEVLGDGEEFIFHLDTFNPIEEIFNGGVDDQNTRADYNLNYLYFNHKEKSALRFLKLTGKRKYIIQARSFLLSSIEKLDFSNANYQSQIEEYAFAGSSVNGVDAWGGLTLLNHGAFAHAAFTEVMIPKDVYRIGYNAFYKNENLHLLNFEPRTSRLQIDREAFSYCALEGKFELPDFSGENGGFAFSDNKMTEVIFPKTHRIIGYRSFQNNPLVSVRGLNPMKVGNKVFLEFGAFSDTKELKNVSFYYSEENNRIHFINPEVFMNGKLRSIELPDFINRIYDPVLPVFSKYNYKSAFAGNVGWYPVISDSMTEEQKRVAIYRLDKDGNYNIDYSSDKTLKDGKHYVVNPVLMKVRILDQNGNPLNKLLIKGERMRGSKAKEVSLDEENFSDFKLGDRFTFEAPKKDGWEILDITGEGITPTVPGNFKKAVFVDLTSENVEEKKYGDDYEVGYKEKVLTLRYKVPDPLPMKVVVKVKFADENGNPLSHAPIVEGEITRIGISLPFSVFIVGKENKNDFLMDDLFSFKLPIVDGYDLTGAEGKGVTATDLSDPAKPFTVVLSETNMEKILDPLGNVVERELILTMKYKKKENVSFPIVIIENDQKEKEKETETKDEKKEDDLEEIPIEKDEVPKSTKPETKKETTKDDKESLDVDADQTPRGGTDVKEEKGKKKVPTLAKTGGLQQHFVFYSTILFIMILSTPIVFLEKKKEKKK